MDDEEDDMDTCDLEDHSDDDSMKVYTVDKRWILYCYFKDMFLWHFIHTAKYLCSSFSVPRTKLIPRKTPAKGLVPQPSSSKAQSELVLFLLFYYF